MSVSEKGHVDSVMTEQRVFPPSADFASRARIKSLAEYESLYTRANADLEGFWAAEAREHLHWFEPFHTTLQWNEPNAKWFLGGKTNASYNCLDAQIAAGMAIVRQFFGKVSLEIHGRSLTSNCTKKFAALPTCSRRMVSAKATCQHLHADDSRAGDRDAGLRTNRGRAFRDLCWLLGRSDR